MPEVCKLWREPVAMGLRVDAGFGGCLLHLLSMLVQTCQKEHFAPT